MLSKKEFKEKINTVIQGDALEVLKTFPDKCINILMTSPPYWNLRNYGVDGQLGLEKNFTEYIEKLCIIFDEVKRVLRDDGIIFVNLGDTYLVSGDTSDPKWNINAKESIGGPSKDNINYGEVKSKSLCCIPDRFKIEMISRGWICRNEIIWYKKNCMPSSVKDRFTVDYEKIFFFSKNKKYYFEQQLEPLSLESQSYFEKYKGKIPDGFTKRGDERRTAQNRDGREPEWLQRKGGRSNIANLMNPQGRNKRSVWTINTKPYREAHFAVFPPELCETPIKAGCPESGIVLDPFFGSGTVGLVADKLGRKWIGIELNPEYIEIAEKRLQQETIFK